MAEPIGSSVSANQPIAFEMLDCDWSISFLLRPKLFHARSFFFTPIYFSPNIELYGLILIGRSNASKYFVTSNRESSTFSKKSCAQRLIIDIRIDVVSHYYVFIIARITTYAFHGASRDRSLRNNLGTRSDLKRGEAPSCSVARQLGAL